MTEEKPKITSRDFAKSNQKFREACELVKIKPTTRQAMKWQNKKGKAYKTVVSGELK